MINIGHVAIVAAHLIRCAYILPVIDGESTMNRFPVIVELFPSENQPEQFQHFLSVPCFDRATAESVLQSIMEQYNELPPTFDIEV